jgi:hypothetical protein
MTLHELLEHVANENVTWRGRSYRLWSDEHHYVIITRQMKPLVEQRLVKCVMAYGYKYTTHGGCELTTEGHVKLSRTHDSNTAIL